MRAVVLRRPSAAEDRRPRPCLLRARLRPARADRRRGLDVGGQDLVREVERDPRGATEVQPVDPLLEETSEVGELGGEPPDGITREGEQSSAHERFDRSRPRRPVQRGTLPEEVALAEIFDVLLGAAPLQEHPQPAFLHDVHRPGRIAFTDDQPLLLDLDRLERGGESSETLGRHVPKRRVQTEEVLQLSHSCETEELLANRGMAVRQRSEDAAVETERVHGAAGANRSHARRLVEQAHLAEARPGRRTPSVTSPPVPACLTTRAVPDTRTKNASASEPSSTITSPKP